MAESESGYGLGRVALSTGTTCAWLSADAREARVATVDAREFDDLPELLEAAGGRVERIAAGTVVDVPREAVLVPVGHPRKILCVGQNYTAHVAETGRTEHPPYPDFFAKWATSLTGPFDDIPLPPESDQIDFESELAVVIGQRCRRVPAERAADVIFGFTAANDVSVRDFQFHASQRIPGKAWDRMTPLGPVVAPLAAVGGAKPDLEITGLLNGTVMQSDRTAHLIYTIPEIVAYLSTFVTLEPGDVILTGTPAGVGLVRTPPVLLQDGDVFEVSIEGIGSLRNRFVTERLP